MCALKWYIKSLYRHLFLEDISKHARVTKKWHFLLFGRPNSHAHWPTCPKLGTNVAKGNSCDLSEKFFFSGEPPLRYRAEKRRDHGNPSFPWPRLFSALYLRGGSPEKKFFSLKSQLLPLATFVPSLGQVGQCAWELGLPNSRKCHFLVTLACFDISSKKRCLYRLFIYHFKAHTISNKLV